MTSLRRLPALCAGLLVCASCVAAPRAAHLDLDVTLDPESREFRATAQWVATARSRLILQSSLVISSVSVNGVASSAAPARRVRDMQEWRIDADAGAALRIEYSGNLPRLDRSLDHRRVLGAIPAMAAPEGSFLPADTGWYPRPGAQFSYRVRLSLPHDQRGLVPGRLLSEDVPRDGTGRYVANFSFEAPADGINLMAGPYVVRERIIERTGAAPLRLRTYFGRELDALADAYLGDCARYIELYSRMIGDYPFTEFSVVASPLPTGFGMPTLTYLGASVLKLPFIRGTSLGHEVLHNWWGNGVYPDYATGNWSEGLTTFMADYFYRARESDAAARAVRLGWLRDFAAVPAGEHRPLAAFRSRAHGAEAAVGYGKSAMVFSMLRDLIGADAFERGIRSFWDRYRFRVASWDDLRRSFEESSGRPLHPFFAQWVERAGGPRVSIVSAHAELHNGAARLVVEFRQSPPVYSLRIPVEIVSGHRPEMRWMEIGREHENIALPVDAIPDGVRLDPELRLWRTLEADELSPILRQWILAAAPRLALASGDAETKTAARALASRFFERAARTVDLSGISGSEPVLLVGLHRDIDPALRQLQLPPRPEALTGRGSAQVWTIVNGRRDAPVAVISARDAASLSAVTGPLPHYGAQSYLAFEGSHVIERGVWPAPGRLIPVTRTPRRATRRDIRAAASRQTLIYRKACGAPVGYIPATPHHTPGEPCAKCATRRHARWTPRLPCLEPPMDGHAYWPAARTCCFRCARAALSRRY